VNINFRSLALTTSCTAPPGAEQQDYAEELKIILMKQLTWVLLFAYTLLLFKPAMPVFIDVLAHTFWEQQHLMTVHEVNGKFHVHYAVANAGGQADKDKSSNNKYEPDEYLFAAKYFVHAAPAFILKKVTYCNVSDTYFSSFPDIDNPPPEIRGFPNHK